MFQLEPGLQNQLCQVQQRSPVQIRAHGWHQQTTTCPQAQQVLPQVLRPQVLQPQRLLQQRRQQPQHVVGDSEDGVEDSSDGEMENVYR